MPIFNINEQIHSGNIKLSKHSFGFQVVEQFSSINFLLQLIGDFWRLSRRR